MANNETTTKFKVDISELKKNFQEASRQIRLANSEFKAATSGMDKWSESADGVSAKITQLSSVLDAQNSQLSSLQKQYELTAKEQGENSKGAQELMIKINNQKAAIGNTEKQIRSYNEKLDKMQSESKDVADSQNKAKTAFDKLSDEISDQESELDKLKNQYSNVVLEQGKNSDEAKELAKQIDSLSGELKENRNRLNDAEDAADEFDHTLEEVDTDEATESFTTMKGALANLVAEGIKAAIQGLKDLAKAAKEAYDEFDEGYDNLIKATGATGETAKDLEKSYRNVAKSVKGEFGDIGSALGEVNTRFGYTGEELEKTTEAFMKFADITGTDATHAIQLVARAMGDAGIDSSEYADVLDELAIAAQASGISVDKLTENLTKYGAPMRALGFDTKEAIAIFSSWEKAGVNTEIAFSGMKNAISKWSGEGKNAREEFKKTLDEIAATPDIASATTKAIEVFGKKAGPDLADAIKGGRFEYSDFLAIIEDSQGTVEKTYEQTQDGFDKIALAAQSLKADVGDAFKNMMTDYASEIEAAIDKVKEILDKAFETFTEKILPKVKDGFQWISDHSVEIQAGIAGIAAAFVAFKAVVFIQKAITAFKALAFVIHTVGLKQAALNLVMSLNPIALVVAAIAGLVAAFVILWKKSDKFREFWINLWETIKEKASNAWKKIKETFEKIKETFEKIWDFLQPYVEKAKKLLSAAFNEIKEMFTLAWEAIKAVWDFVKPYFLDIWENIKKTFSVVSEVLGKFFKVAWEIIKIIWDVAVQYFQLIWDNIKVIFSAAKDTLGGFFKLAWEAIKATWDVASGYFKMVWNNIKEVFEIVKKVLSGDFEGAWDSIKSIWDNTKNYFQIVWDNIKNVFLSVEDFFKTAFSSAWEAVKGVFSNVGEFFEGIWDTIKEKFTSVGTMVGDAIGGAFKTAINAAIGTVERALNFIPNKVNPMLQTITDLTGVELPYMPTINLPRLAKGGIVNKRTLATIGEAGEEAVIPLERNTEGLKKIAKLIAEYMPKSDEVSLDRLIDIIKSSFDNLIAAIKDIDIPKIELPKINDNWLDDIADRLSDKVVLQTQPIQQTVNNNTTNNFNQTNNSPKSLSRLEIYRQSKNLLRMKG